MKIILLSLFLFVTAAAIFGQRKENSVCLNAVTETDRAILTICNKHTGMGGTRLRLYLRVYADGTGEYEENDGIDNLVLRKVKVGDDHIAEFAKLGAAKDLQAAKDDYPIFRRWTDTALESTVIFRDPKNNSEKKIVVRNYIFGDETNYEHYPTSLVTLLSLAEEARTGKMTLPKFTAYNGGILEVGKTYRGQVNFGDAYGMRLTKFPKLPYHHSVMYDWTNVKDFPALDPDKDYGVRWVVFKVVDREVDNFRKNNWITTYTMEIIEVEK